MNVFSKPDVTVHMNIYTNSVMQSDGNSFSGDVVFDRFYMAYRDKTAFRSKIIKRKYLETLS